jgi:hypothetical protein
MVERYRVEKRSRRGGKEGNTVDTYGQCMRCKRATFDPSLSPSMNPPYFLIPDDRLRESVEVMLVGVHLERDLWDLLSFQLFFLRC